MLWLLPLYIFTLFIRVKYRPIPILIQLKMADTCQYRYLPSAIELSTVRHTCLILHYVLQRSLFNVAGSTDTTGDTAAYNTSPQSCPPSQGSCRRCDDITTSCAVITATAHGALLIIMRLLLIYIPMRNRNNYTYIGLIFLNADLR